MKRSSSSLVRGAPLAEETFDSAKLKLIITTRYESMSDVNAYGSLSLSMALCTTGADLPAVPVGAHSVAGYM